MLINEYLQLRNNLSVQTGRTTAEPMQNTVAEKDLPQNSDFANELKKQLGALENNGGVQFSKHAMERLSERNIDMGGDNMLDRLNRAVELAGEKGSDETLVMIGSTAFLVSVKNNKVITTMTAEDMRGNIFTNIDSTVIM